MDGPTVVLGDGSTVAGVSDGTVARFHGIPYALPPVDDLRWMPPQRRTARALDHDGSSPAEPALQVGVDGQPTGTEDGLRLDVIAPHGAVSGAHPVMVWVHGGGFTGGRPDEPHARADAFVRAGIVVVQVRYRLGVLGWLRFPDDDGGLSDGNLGILDLIAALGWIEENVAAFGGAPDRLTLVGQSAGGSMVAAALTHPELPMGVRGAVIQSGTLDHVLSIAEADEVARRVARAADVRTVGELRHLPVAGLLRAQARVVEGGHAGGDPRRFLPFATVGPTATVAGCPADLVDRLRPGVAVVVGANLDEMSVFAAPGSEPDDLVRWAEPLHPEDPEGFVNRYGTVDEGPRDRYVAMWTDAVFRQPALRYAQALRAAGHAVWHYDLRWPSSLPGFGAAHSLELRIVFDTTDDPAAQLTHAGISPTLVDLVHGSWSAFIATGDPDPTGGGRWPSFHETGASLILGGDPFVTRGMQANSADRLSD